MIKNKKTLTTLALAFSLTFSSLTVYAEDSIDEMKNKIQESEKKKEELSGELGKVHGEITTIRERMILISKEIEETTAKIADVEQKIKETDIKITQKQEQIKQTEIELEIKKEALAHNLRTMYSKGDVSFMEYLFRSDDVSEFLGRYDSIKRIARANEALYQEVRDKQEQLKREKKELDQEKAKQVAQKEQLVALKQTQEAKRQEEMVLLAEMVKKEESIEHEIESQEAAINELNSQIAEIVRQREEERKRREQAGIAPTEPVGSGQMMIPVPAGRYIISSGFGYRTHPITGERKLHNGVDFAAPYNTPILAADSGTVIYSGPARGYGNWIVIDHNNGYYSIYGHMESGQLYVSPGQTVSKGQHIAGMGSAGQSTGVHLHLAICYGEINQNFVDPMTMF